jgi:putative spermidine/putrescine transport system permease protein
MTLVIQALSQAIGPRQMWSGVRESLSPTIAAVVTLLIVASIVLLAGLQWLQRRAAGTAAVTPA